MREAVWAGGVLLLLGAVASVQLLGFEQLVTLGQAVMLGSAALGIPLELLYFAFMTLALRDVPACPRGWYWRSFEHHTLLSPSARRRILPFFYVGALAMLGIVLGIALVLLAFVGAARGA